MTTTDHAPATGPVPPTTHAHDGPVVVFHIGMTIRRPHRPDLWGPVMAAMPRMVAELERHRSAAARGQGDDLGFLGAQYVLGGRGPWVLQYWRSTEQLYAYSRSTEHAHLPAWRAFNAAARRHPGAVGIWHETFAVPADGIETIGAGGAIEGLARVAGTVPVGRRGRGARERLGRTS
ncbi:DUF4188 domain-containing protein [Brachybacterium huguangmaarense]